MPKYNINSFRIGDNVFHISNRKLRMAVIGINADLNEIKCRWIDDQGRPYTQEFLPEELGKSSDLAPRIISI